MTPCKAHICLKAAAFVKHSGQTLPDTSGLLFQWRLFRLHKSLEMKMPADDGLFGRLSALINALAPRCFSLSIDATAQIPRFLSIAQLFARGLHHRPRTRWTWPAAVVNIRRWRRCQAAAIGEMTAFSAPCSLILAPAVGTNQSAFRALITDFLARYHSFL